MSQPTPDQQSQEQDNLIKDTNVSGDLIFAPVQIGTKIETQIVQISVAKVTQQPLIKNSPYQGLKRFNLKDRDRFFGRDKLIARLFEAVNRSNLSLVLGASGSGKSSVVRAGLIPEIEKSLESQTFYDFIFTPNQDPFDSLYRSLLSEEKDYSFSKAEAEIAKEAKADTLPKVISRLRKNDERWLIFVDQFEELFTICDDPGKRKNFVTGLVQIATSKNSFVKIVLAMRSDFLEQFSFYPDLGAIANQNNIHLVTEMYPDELRQAIEQPAAKHGVVFEEGLVEQIIKEVEGQKGYLPLLQYTLNLLWENECNTPSADGRFEIEDRTLNEASYRALEGVRGALQNRVNGIYRNLNQDEQKSTKQMFLKLVNIVDTESGSKAVSRRAYRDEFVGESVEKLLEQFIDANLLVSSSDYSKPEELQTSDKNRLKQSATVEIAHEILLASWDKLKGWLVEEKEAIVQKNLLASEVRRWQETLLKDKLNAQEDLLKGSRLDEVVKFRNKDAFNNLGGLSPLEEEYINASAEWQAHIEKEQEARRKREIKTAWGIAVGSVGAFVISGGLGLMAWQKTQQAEFNQAEALGRESLSLLNENKTLEARIQAIKAGKILQSQHTTNSEVLDSLREILLLKVAEKNNLQDNQSPVNRVSFSPDDKTLAGSRNDGTITIWEVETGKILQTLKDGNQSPVNEVTFSPDSKTLASSRNDGTVTIWQIGTDKPLQIFKDDNNSRLNRMSFSPDSKTLARIHEDNTVKIWQVETGKLLQTVKDSNNSRVNEVSLSEDGKTLVVVRENAKVTIWDVETGKLLHTLKDDNNSRVNEVSLSEDGKTLVVVRENAKVTIWDVETGKLLQTVKDNNNSRVKEVSLSEDGKTLVVVRENAKVTIWEMGTGKLLQTLKDDTLRVNFSPDSKLLVSEHRGWTITIWDIGTGKPLKFQGDGNNSPIWWVVFSPDSKTLAILRMDGTVTIWQVGTGKLLQSLNGEFVMEMRFSPDSKTLGILRVDGTVSIWEVGTNKPPQTLKNNNKSSTIRMVDRSSDGQTWASVESDGTVTIWEMGADKLFQTLKDDNIKDDNINDAHTFYVRSVSFSPDSKTLAIIREDEKVKIWQVGKDKLPQILKEDNKSSVLSVSLSPDSKTLATGSVKGTVKIWDVGTSKPPQTLKGSIHDANPIYSLSFSPDGKTLATGSSHGKVRTWDLGTSKPLQTLTGNRGSVLSVGFGRDGKTLASGSDDGTVKIWDLGTGKPLQTLKGHEGDVNSVSFSPDGKILASSSSDGTVKIWDLETNKLLQTIKSIKNPSFSADYKYSVSFSSDGKTLAHFGYDDTVELWDLDLLTLDAMIASNCDWVRNYLTYNPNVSESDRHLCDSIGTK